ncbi:alpha/beta hydrolase [Actinoplanes sp. ATCC 53533]|uniref:alpha/beta fold hydrolase n=1 Tax=Actinoplanes sp. ATCC 53533 TaxID=1288362 RepID=UPI000F7B6232|nr:alpha/beta fold hydrolase [Actinoplanes sp. ATCC 53533]RSM58453.1 alpha/beta hydrolase [Actinoplanes sp. ATCC 53533]
MLTTAGLSIITVISLTTGAATGALPGDAPVNASHSSSGVSWHPCALGTGDAEGRALDDAGVECGDVTVPLDYARPGGRDISVAIARSRGSDTAHRIGSMIINLGGPASPVLDSIPLARAAMGATGERFDLIGMDPRFAGRSTPVDCHWPAYWLPRSAGADRAGFDAMVSLDRDLARRCGRSQHGLLRHASTANMARDMDTIRAALGEPRLSYLGYSQGSYLGAVYAQLFPRRADRIVLDSAINPALSGTRVLRDAAPGREAQLREWAAWAAARDATYHLGTTADAVLGTVRRVYAASARRPLAVGPYAVDDTLVPALILTPLTDDTENGELADVVRLLARAADGMPTEPTEEMTATLASLVDGVGSATHTAQTAILCGDAAVSRDPEVYWRDAQRHRTSSPLFEPLARTITPCSFWPDAPAERPVDVHNGTPALIVQAEKDVNSQLPGAAALHRALTGSRMIVLAGTRTHGVYLFRGATCVDEAVDGYLRSGRLPATDLTCAE